MDNEQRFPQILQTVLDCSNIRELAEFYRQLFGLQYRPGDEPPPAGSSKEDGADWIVLRDSSGANRIAFQKTDEFREPTWPGNAVPQQIHLDTIVPTIEDLNLQHERAIALGGRLLFDRSDNHEEPLRVYADPEGHPFCIFVAAPHPH
ncbi:MAG: VOC family protein [Acidimicrobiales bacterium]